MQNSSDNFPAEESACTIYGTGRMSYKPTKPNERKT